MKTRRAFLFLSLALFWLYSACSKDPISTRYKTRKVVLVSIDGPRWSETWGDSAGRLIPHRYNDLLPQGVLVNNFSNPGYTYTNAGHTTMITGVYQPINNSGTEHPNEPNMFQCWQKATGFPREKTWIISSKDKIEALADCKNTDWAGNFLPLTDCGVSGLGSGYRHDSITFRRAKEIFTQYHPTLSLVHFREPDYSGHSAVWADYLAGIRMTDQYVWQLWNFLQQDPEYAGVTTMIITNDHGRHIDGVSSGYVSHGDYCIGCTHIELLAMGPDFKQNVRLDTHYQQKDIAPTIAELLGFRMEHGDGVVMKELFR